MTKEQIQFISVALEGDLKIAQDKINLINKAVEVNQQFCKDNNHFDGFIDTTSDSHKQYRHCKYCYALKDF